MFDKVLSMMDELYADFLAGDLDVHEFTAKLGTVMAALPLDNNDTQKTFDVVIVNRNRNESYFGFRFYPEINDAKSIVAAILTNTSYDEAAPDLARLGKWYVEIDAQMFDRATINFTPKEYTAMTLQALGHSIYSGRPLLYFYEAFRGIESQLNPEDKACIEPAIDLLMIPLITAQSQHYWLKDTSEVAMDFFHHPYLKEFGYGDALVVAMNRIISRFGSLYQSEHEKFNRVEADTDLAISFIKDMDKRQRLLRDTLFQKACATSSPYYKALCVHIIRSLGVRLRERYTGAAVEATVENVKPGMFEAYEAFYDMKLFGAVLDRLQQRRSQARTNISHALESRRNSDVPSQYDIDRIAIEVDRIENHHDRIYVMDLLYRQNERIAQFTEMMERDSGLRRKHAPMINSMQKQLVDLRLRVLANRSFAKEYKFFVKYPEGYEG